MADTETKAPLQKAFEPKGAPFALEIVPVEDTPETPAKTLEVEFGIFKTWREGEEPKLSGRFRVTYPRVVDGMEDHLIALGADPAKAVAQVIKLSGRGNADDYTFDLDHEFFDQKFEAPKQDENDVWHNPKFAGLREELIELRGEAETALTTAEDAKENAQEEARVLAGVIKSVFDKLSGRRKALESWAKGAEGAGNYPHLAKLGKGSNALYEAMRLATITDAQFDVLPSTITSGKGVDTHKSRALATLVEDVTIKVEWPEGYETNTGTRIPGVEGMAAILRRIASKALGIVGVDDMDLTQLGEAVNDTSARLAGEFSATFGKQVNTYDKNEYGEALRAYAVVTISEGGEDLFKSAITAITEANDEDDDKAAIKKLVDLYNNNLMVKKAVDVCSNHAKTLEREAKNREMLKQTEEEDGPISKSAAKGFAKLEALPAAAHLFKLLNTHPDAAGVWDAMQSLVRQQGGFKKVEETENEDA